MVAPVYGTYVAEASATDNGEVVEITFPFASTARKADIRPLPSES